MRDPCEASKSLCSQKDLSQVSWQPVWVRAPPKELRGRVERFRIGGDFPPYLCMAVHLFPVHVVFVKF